MPPPKPTIILLPGAWHTPDHYTTLLTTLQSLNYPTRSLKLPSVNPTNPHLTTVESEAAFVREELLLPELDAGNDVIIIAHSYGGVIAGAAAKGLGRGDRGEGKSAVLGWVFLCAIVGFKGKMMCPKKEDLVRWAKLDEETGMTSIPDPASCVYTHVDDAEAVKKAMETVGTHSFTAFNSESPDQAWEDDEWDGKRVYVRCEQDQAVSVAIQDFFVSSTQVKWEIETLEDAGHSPFMSHVDKLTEIVEKYCEQWV